MSKDVVAAVDVGGTHVRGALVDAGRHVVIEAIAERALDGDHDDAETILDAIAACVVPAAGPVAIAMPGPFDYARGVGDFAHVTKFAALRGVDVGSAIAARLGRTVRPVVFVNDAEAYGLGEWLAGAGRGVGRVLVITLGTGIGSVFLDGGDAVRKGALIPPDGHAHLLVHGGRPIEETFSRAALRRAYRAATSSEHEVDVDRIAQSASAGDPTATAVIAQATTGLGRALAPCVGAFAPERIVMGGAMARSWGVFDAWFRLGLGAVADRLDIRVSELGDRAPLIGAAHHAVRTTT
jgi:glucokinase